MTSPGRSLLSVRLLILALSCAALANCGCLLVAAGSAAGAAAGIAYVNGKVSATYFAFPNDVWMATRQGLTELGMPVMKESFDGLKGSLESKTPDNDKVYITLECVSPAGMVEGAFTRLSIRIATFGDRDVSKEIFRQIGSHLPAPGLPTSTTPVTLNGGATISVTPALTAAKPLTATNFVVPQPIGNPMGNVGREPPRADSVVTPVSSPPPGAPQASTGPTQSFLPALPVQVERPQGPSPP